MSTMFFPSKIFLFGISYLYKLGLRRELEIPINLNAIRLESFQYIVSKLISFQG